jgi:hypothetical protein
VAVPVDICQRQERSLLQPQVAQVVVAVPKPMPLIHCPEPLEQLAKEMQVETDSTGTVHSKVPVVVVVPVGLA